MHFPWCLLGHKLSSSLFRDSEGSFWVQRGRWHFGRPLHTSPWLSPFQVGWAKSSSLWCWWELGRQSKNSSFLPRVGFIRTYRTVCRMTVYYLGIKDVGTEDSNFRNPFVLFQTLLYCAVLGKSLVALPDAPSSRLGLFLHRFIWSLTLSWS